MVDHNELEQRVEDLEEEVRGLHARILELLGIIVELRETDAAIYLHDLEGYKKATNASSERMWKIIRDYKKEPSGEGA